ncbi:MAG: ATP-binding protein, partial [Rhodospirillales bacterium]|nr:ATP-binding protein [Rhodospirillales bacterium]
AQESSRTKSEFLATMSHELRTPLNAIIGFSEIMTEQTFGALGNGKYGEYAVNIHESGHHLLDLINDILDVSKIEAGSLDIHPEDLSLEEVIETSVRLIRDRAQAANVTVEAELEEGLPLLSADSRRIIQILLNLLSNAVKFTPAGGRVVVRADCPRPENQIRLSVSDTGIGIAAEDIEKAMSPFGQVDGDLSRKYEGTGLGLPLTKGLVELHGGILLLSSRLGQGTTVTVLFPPERTGAAVPVTQKKVVN